jgi:hypothetical protein
MVGMALCGNREVHLDQQGIMEERGEMQVDF